MKRPLRRLRGLLLRLALSRRAAVVVGLLLLGLALALGGDVWESWWTDATALVLGATGVALIVASLGGRRPDWIDPEQ